MEKLHSIGQVVRWYKETGIIIDYDSLEREYKVCFFSPLGGSSRKVLFLRHREIKAIQNKNKKVVNEKW